MGIRNGIPSSLEAITGVPGWAASTLLLSICGLVVAGYGFYTDVAWHVALVRPVEKAMQGAGIRVEWKRPRKMYLWEFEDQDWDFDTKVKPLIDA